ncbi:hypothetical protein DY000_02022212 [Brassica cretica]|uniref:SMP domain-containing protein n=1 Tax=Brassica cretica TaxID=69181 RepID=A0ABQ7E8A5_BRACR|nr:hypothetical protein DY000_02022212 [Brassica cretica]
MGRVPSSGIRAESVLGQSKYSGLLGQTILPSLTSRGKLCVLSPDPKLVLTNLPVILLQMTKSNRNTRRTMNETAEGSASNIRNYDTVAELVEKAAEQEAGISEEAKVFGTVAHVHPGKHAGKNQKPVKAGSSSKPNATGRSACSTCGKMHSGVCRAATGACHRCGTSRMQQVAVRVRLAGRCTLVSAVLLRELVTVAEPAAKKQAIMPRVYTIGDESMDPSTSRMITGESSYPSPLP